MWLYVLRSIAGHTPPLSPEMMKNIFTWYHLGVGTCPLLPLDKVAADVGNRQPATWVLLPSTSLSQTLHKTM